MYSETLNSPAKVETELSVLTFGLANGAGLVAEPDSGVGKQPTSRRYRKPGLTSAGEIPDGLVHFPKLPDDARVRQPVVEGLFGISAATLWRWVRRGILPPPRRCGRISSWVVSELRAVMAEMSK